MSVCARTHEGERKDWSAIKSAAGILRTVWQQHGDLTAMMTASSTNVRRRRCHLEWVWRDSQPGSIGSHEEEEGEKALHGSNTASSRNAGARPPLHDAHAAARGWICNVCDSHRGSVHWGEFDGIQRGQRVAFAA